ncbi:MAG: hypothetical protein HOV77_32420 [Hamadaea sp.]|uniref:hypothetical protein n=1 Tax=Hamadaea sp. TaxID=2024425 RepID=UPI00180E32B2|nr:hypothetical protein [Hamadaea sp.]NUT23893.1 hypothetical protein [Hamadaea sp.]
MRRLYSVAIALSLVLTGCGSSGPSTSQPTASRGRSTVAFTESTVDQYAESLAAAGIGVYRPGESKPLSEVKRPAAPMRLLREQVANAALGVWAYAGLRGRDVDSLVSTPRMVDGAKPIPASLLIIAWAQTAPGAKAELAKQALGTQNWAHYQDVTFPTIVLALFAADVAPAVESTGGSGGGAQAVSGCEAVTGFIHTTIEKVFAAIGHIKIVTSSGGWFMDALTFIRNLGAAVVNFGIDKIKAIVIGGVDLALRPVISAIATVASVVAVASQILLFLQPWTGDIRPDPGIARRDASAHDGTMTLRVRAGSNQPQQWPPEIEGCARVAGVTLPSLTPKDADVTWTVFEQAPGPMVVKVSDSGPLAADSTATWRYQTLPEPPDVAEGKLMQDGIVQLSAKVHRKDLDDLHERVTSLLFQGVPTLIQQVTEPFIRSVVGPAIQRLLSPLTALRDVTILGVLPVDYHVPDDEKTAAPGTSVRPGGKVAVLPQGCPDAAAAAFGYGQREVFNHSGVQACSYIGPSKVQLVIGVSKTVSTSPRPDVENLEPVDIPGADAAWSFGGPTGPLGPEYFVDVIMGDKTLTVAGGESRERIIAITRKVLGLE